MRNARLDYLAANPLGRALLAPVFDSLAQPPNSARFAFLDPRAADFYDDWDGVTNDLVAILRTQAGHHPQRQGPQRPGRRTVETFRARWAAHNVRLHHSGTKRLRHPVVGDLDLAYESMDLPADPGLTMHVYHAEPASPSADALNLLASWAAIQEPQRL